jgi:hypothetical protein
MTVTIGRRELLVALGGAGAAGGSSRCYTALAVPLRAVPSQGIICGDRDEKKGSGHHAEKGYGE